MVVAGARAGGVGVVGTVTRVEPSLIEVQTDQGVTTSVAVDAKTTYMKWITQKPWQQDLRASGRFVTVGTRVHIDVARDHPGIAKVVWIVVR